VIPSALVVAVAIIGSAFLITIVLAVIGLVGAASKGAQLNARIDGYKNLPIVHAVQTAQTDVELLRAKLAEIELLLARAQLATDQIRASLRDFAATVGRVRTVFAALGANVKILWRALGRTATRQRTPGS
jgi:hypothetical protein